MKGIWYLSKFKIISQKSIKQNKTKPNTETTPEFQRLTKPNKHENGKKQVIYKGKKK